MKTSQQTTATHKTTGATGNTTRETTRHKHTSRANPNIALIKYWGKKDEQLVLPEASSLSLTLNKFPTTTTVTLTPQNKEDTLTLNGKPQTGETLKRVQQFLELVRTLAANPTPAHINSLNEAPTGAGLASSAAGFAALTHAATNAYGLQLAPQELSRLARRGSGSATRSVYGGLSIWQTGDDKTSYAHPIQNDPQLAMITVTLDTKQKKVSSRAAMRISRETSPLYKQWAKQTENAVTKMLTALQANEFNTVGELTEWHALLMHKIIEEGNPAIRYLTAASKQVFQTVAEIRRAGTPAYATADAGPNVAILVQPETVTQVTRELRERLHPRIAETANIQTCLPGEGVRTVQNDVKATGSKQARSGHAKTIARTRG